MLNLPTGRQALVNLPALLSLSFSGAKPARQGIFTYICKGGTQATADNAEALPNSNFGGVQIGAITYSWRDMPGGVENVIKYCKETGISSIELMSSDVEAYLGAPQNRMMGFF